MGVTFPEVTGDVLAHEPVIQLRACLPRNKSPPASGSSEYMHKLRGCNINFEHQGACKSVLLPEQTKLQAAAFDRNAQEAQMANYHSNQMQTRRNKSLNQVDQIALSFADDGGNPFTRHTMSSSLRKTQAETNYKDLLARRDHIKGIHHGSMGNEFLYHSTGNSAGECVQVRNTAKQLPMLDAFIGAERLPGAPVNVFKTMVRHLRDCSIRMRALSQCEVYVRTLCLRWDVTCTGQFFRRFELKCCRFQVAYTDESSACVGKTANSVC